MRAVLWLAALSACSASAHLGASLGVAAHAPAEPKLCPEPSPTAAPALSSGNAPLLPSVRLDKEPIQYDDEAYTVWGASYYLRSRPHRAEVTREPIRITGYITKTSLPDAPACAVHRGGKADPENCRASMPTFWLGDSPDTPLSDCIRVLGFASSYAQIYDAIALMDQGKRGERFIDTFWGVAVPNPLPARGAKVTVQGRYGTSFTKSTSEVVSDPTMGILTFDEMLTLEPAAEPATLPGVTRRSR